MRNRYHIIYSEWLFVIVYWFLVFYLYYLYVFVGYGDQLIASPLTYYINSGYAYYELFIQAILFGLLFNIINTLTDQPKIRRRSLGKIILLKSSLYFIAIVFSELIVLLIFYLFDLMSYKDYGQFGAYASVNFYISFLVYFIISSLFINFFLQMNRKVGPGNMINLLLGRYHKPHDEDRIFMFLDLKSSTTIAEKLGHKIYSQFIRDCFQDLTDTILRHRADIYQFVGDEVILTWNQTQGLKGQTCFRAFFDFKEALLSRRNYYLHTYNIIPEFRAGMDKGIVTATEIGDIKREIAYHGDVLNTAARLLGQCNKYNKNLLVSQNIARNFKNTESFQKNLVGEVQLRGKKNVVKIYSIEENNQ